MIKSTHNVYWKANLTGTGNRLFKCESSLELASLLKVHIYFYRCALRLLSIQQCVVVFSIRHHAYADDTQLLACAQLKNVNSACRSLERCVADIHEWGAQRRLQLNPEKN